MPKIPTRRDLEVADALARWAKFEDTAAWKPSKSNPGNIWRNYEGMTVTIFRRDGDGYFGWCIVDGDGRRFSRGAWETEADAMSAAGEELGVGF